jgi:hypothetical protein
MRYNELSEDMILFENAFMLYKRIGNVQYGDYCLGEKFFYNGTEIIFWRTTETNVNSLNYFTDGVISDEYFIVEGYLKNYHKGV